MTVTDGGPPSDPRDYRCADSDREVVAEVIRRAAADGRFTVPEAGDRLQQAYSATTYRDLEGVLSDLPAEAVPDGLRLIIPGSTSNRRTRGTRSGTPPPGRPPAGHPIAAEARSVDGLTAGDPAGVDPFARVVDVDVDSPLPAASAVAILSEVKREGIWTLPAESTATAVLGSVRIDLRDAWLASAECVIQAAAVMGEVSIVVPDDILVVAEGTGILGEFDGRSEHVPGYPVVHLRGVAIFGEVSVKRTRRRHPRAR